MPAIAEISQIDRLSEVPGVTGPGQVSIIPHTQAHAARRRSGLIRTDQQFGQLDITGGWA
ncbi:MAG: hypothetical protein DRH70_01775 [Candidatus Coatesbacteria bacterium]|nr:MAG: hypothetical protein DRH70_01775 [Candidatus Coatesbacteria bacterium]